MHQIALTPEETARYMRQTSMPGFGIEGQLRLKQSSVLVIGAGGLGSPVLMYLAAAGVGHIGIADGDCVDLSNLQRQIIHTTRRIGMPKTESAAAALREINPNVRLTLHNEFLTPETIAEIIAPYDFIVDATDSFDAKFMINDACVNASKPYSHGGISQYYGQLLTWTPGHACYRCLFDSAPEFVGPVGPLGVLPGVIGTLQATEAIKYLTSTGELLTDTLLIFDALAMTFRRISLAPSPSHPHR